MTQAQAFLSAELPQVDSDADRAGVINQAIAMLPSQFIDTRTALYPRLTLPFGVWDIDAPIMVERAVDLDLGGGALRLTSEGEPGVVVRPPSWGSRIHSGTIIGKQHSGHSAPGVVINAHGTQLADLLIRETGIGVEVGSQWQLGWNANAFKLRDVKIYRTASHGLLIKGGDTNGGEVSGLWLHGCGGDGIQDQGFLGSDFYATHWHTIAGYCYRCPVGANRSRIFGGYIEADCGAGVGGVHQSVWTDSAGTLFCGGDPVYYARGGERVGGARTSLLFGDKLPDGGRLTVRIPSGAKSSVMAVTRHDANGQAVETWDLRHVPTLKQWGIVTSGDGLTRPLGWTAVNHAEGEGHAKVDAEHFSVGSPAGHDVQHAGEGEP